MHGTRSSSAVPLTDAGPLREEIEGREWYHTIELGPGAVTAGWFDTRALPPQIGFPASLRGKRCLDIGTFDGFWAFEMERREADEVIAIDVLDPRQWDWPPGSGAQVVQALERRKDGGSGFDLVSRSLGSRVARRELSVYDLDPELIGQFDFVYLGSLLLHLRDPLRALERVRAVTRGSLMVLDAIDLPLSILLPRRPVASLDGLGRPWWWRPNQAGLVRMVEAAGFELSAAARRIRMPPGPGHPIHSLRRPRDLWALRHRAGRELAFAARFGSPHCVLVGRPREG
jgi:tRNA (mo5U34)-methyltransferase